VFDLSDFLASRMSYFPSSGLRSSPTDAFGMAALVAIRLRPRLRHIGGRSLPKIQSATGLWTELCERKVGQSSAYGSIL